MISVVLWAMLASAAESSAAAAGDDRTVSVGLWDVVAVEMNGREFDRELVTLLRVDFRADGRWSVLFRSLPLVDGTSTNDQTADPKTFEVETLARPPAKPARYVGIYRFEGDARRLCFVEEGRPRPDTFTAPAGSGRLLVKLARAARPERDPRAGRVRRACQRDPRPGWSRCSVPLPNFSVRLLEPSERFVIVPEPNFCVWPVTLLPSRPRSVVMEPEPNGRVSVVVPSDQRVIVPVPNFCV